MDDKVRASWEKVLNPETLKTNIITASIFSMAFEMLKDSIIRKIRAFYVDGLDPDCDELNEDYKLKVLSLNKSVLYASLQWLKNINAIDESDIEKFDHIKRCRNTLAHEMLRYASSGVDFKVGDVFDDMVNLLRKIEIWWFENFDLSIAPELYPENIDPKSVIPGPVWSLQMLINIALGPEDEAKKYYEQFLKNASET
ncbi:hypothetical protein ACE41O_06305 [Alteromonas macleodii]|uniref:hypothetical protein n=1 Tax=Alteromonas macleodii TaxID=28108 RepID=UPI00314025A4